jgi:hypothetical protein
MTPRTPSLTVKKFATLLGIARNFCRTALALKLAQIGDNIRDVVSESSESGHPRSRHSPFDDAKEFEVGASLCPGVHRNVRSPFAATPV